MEAVSHTETQPQVIVPQKPNKCLSRPRSRKVLWIEEGVGVRNSLKSMSKNEQTTSVADALAAAELTAPRALKTNVSETETQSTKASTVDEVPALETSPSFQSTASNGEDEPTSETTHSLSSEIHWIAPKQLEINPLSDNIYGSDVPTALLASITENGIKSPLIVAKASMRVISGNTRLRVAKQLSLEKVPILFIEGQISDEEEQNLVLSHNVARDKTNEMRVREYRCYLDIEKELTRQRVAAGKKRSATVPNLAHSKSRDVAADKVGGAHSSLETGLKVLKTMDKLTAEGKTEEAARLRDILNANGYSPAKNLAVNQGWLVEDSQKKAKRSKAKANPEPRESTSAVLEPSRRPDQVEEQSPAAQEELQGDSNPSGSESEERIPQQDIDPRVPDTVLKAFDEIEAFLRGEHAAVLSDDLRMQIGVRLGKLNAAAICEGITIKAI